LKSSDACTAQPVEDAGRRRARRCGVALPAQALDTRKIELSLPAGGKTYQVTAEPLSAWQLASEGQLSLDQRFDIQPDGTHGTIQVKLIPAPAKLPSKPNPCTLLQGLGKALKDQGARVSAGRVPQANLAPVCSMIAEGTLKTQFYYASMFITGEVIVAGVASNARDLSETQITDFQRYLASIKATPKETSQ
jgi:hypothetical protein